MLHIIEEIEKIDGIERIRIGSIEPAFFTEEGIEKIRGFKKLCPHFHLSLQSGCNETLKRMNRHYKAEDFKEKALLLRKYFDRPALTTDVIVGFPGETEEQYHNLLDFLEEMKLDCVGAFPYSREEGTAADRMDGHLEEDEKEKRAENLMELQYDTMYRKHETAIGQRRLVKVDELSPDIPGLLLCRSEGEAPDVDPWILVFEAEDHNYQPGDYFTVEITGLDEYDFVGEIV